MLFEIFLKRKKERTPGHGQQYSEWWWWGGNAVSGWGSGGGRGHREINGDEKENIINNT